MSIHDVRRVGLDAVLVRVGDATQAASLAAWVRASEVAVVEVVPGAETVLLDGLARDVLADVVAEVLDGWSPDAEPAEPGALVDIAVTYDGPDLADVAARWGTDVDSAVARHAGLELTAAFGGFAPGFAYLTGLPGELAVPRLETPRARVPAGAVALAGPWCGVYPTASPGGWRLIGRTEAVLWDQDRTPPALLPPGTRVRFTPV